MPQFRFPSARITLRVPDRPRCNHGSRFLTSAQRTDTAETWRRVVEHGREVRSLRVDDMFARDPRRFARLSLEACGLLLDFSKQRVSEESIDLLLSHARALHVPERIEALLGGEDVNFTEGRAALHCALRHFDDGPYPSETRDVMPRVRGVRKRMRAFCDALHRGELRGFSGRRLRNVVNIGIGGSDLGPAMASEALAEHHRPGVTAHFVSNIESTELARVLDVSDPEETLFIVVSKTFSTRETLVNAASARDWLVRAAGDPRAVARHFVTATARVDRAAEFGIDSERVFELWDWVGGRYSMWSAAGLAIAAVVGADAFEELLAGAGDMDLHFRSAPLGSNAPVLLALIGIWNRNALGAPTLAVLPYDCALGLLPPYLQQLEMESNGKGVDRAGRPTALDTCPVVWGGLGNDAQHAFFQKLHQGSEMVPCDFIVAAQGQRELGEHHLEAVANALAQSHAMMRGRRADEVSGEPGTSAEQASTIAAHRAVPGNQPSTTIVYDRLGPRVLGALIALYEHKVFVQGVCWGVNSFDQWGVELGKEIARDVLGRLEGKGGEGEVDASTAGLMRHVLSLRRRSAEA